MEVIMENDFTYGSFPKNLAWNLAEAQYSLSRMFCDSPHFESLVDNCGQLN